ncbi:hypothetical protein [Candidatus Laterigemmans baculatus]|uniref:hypothetical protein n=1 Tax=Candidatus Laterigemmans baculatus TaxID=2770505 RepID=UPI0013DC3884|nr:hypothetical protein [Candidatus Laterigemmans baculatus]
MFSPILRLAALPLLFVALSAAHAPANWFSDWFRPVAHEELPTPAPTPDPVSSGASVIVDDSVPTLAAPHQSLPYESHRWAEDGITTPDWPAEGDTIYSDVPLGSETLEYPEILDGESAIVEGPGIEGSGIEGSGALLGGGDWPNVWDAEGADQGVQLFDPPFPTDLDDLSGLGGRATCCDVPTIRYWNHPLIGWATGHAESVEQQYTILELAGGCCPTQVPVTIPASVVGVPELETHQGLFGRTTHTFCWPCGYRLKIVRWGDGDLMVHTYNPLDVFPLQCMRGPSGGRLIEL